MRKVSSPRTLQIAAVILGIEAVAFAAFAVVELASVNPTRIAVGVGAALCLLGYAVLLGASGRGLWRGRRMARGAAVTTQLLHLFVGFSFLSGQPGLGSLLTGLGLMGAAVVVGVCIFWPSSTRYLTAED